MIAIIAGTVIGTIASIVVVHYIRVGLRRWVKKEEKGQS